MGRLFPSIIKSHEYEPEACHVRCHSPRRNANSITWKAMQTIIQDARFAFGAEGGRIGMSANEMKKIYSQEEKLNQMKCPHEVRPRTSTASPATASSKVCELLNGLD